MRYYSGLILFVVAALAAILLLSACSSFRFVQREGTAPPVWTVTALDAAPTPSTAADQAIEAKPTADPLIPTEAPAAAVAPQLTVTLPLTGAAVLPESVAEADSSTLEAMPTPATESPSAAQPGEPDDLRSRLGVGVPLGVTDFEFDAEMAQRLRLGWYLDWHVEAQPVRTDGQEFAQMVRVRGSRFLPSRPEIVRALAANPGSLWLIGNEPDVQWQDNTTPEDYAQRYHELYVFIKTLDPSAQVAIGGVSQVTPLRLGYLERVMAAYEQRYGEPLPVDVWNVHTFILREERDSWGVSIPPGFDDVQQGMLWEIEDHDDLDLLKQQIVDFRRWMVQHGQRDKPLIVTEFGILMPEGYGFPPEAVAQYMQQSFDLLLTASDPEIGYPADDNRLVQRILWYSLSDTVYPTSNLVDPITGNLTALGEAFAGYTVHLDTSP